MKQPKHKKMFSKVRINVLFKNGCKCSTGICFQQFSKTEILDFLVRFDELPKLDQDMLLLLCRPRQNQITTNQPARLNYSLLGKSIRKDCFLHLLGMGSHRLCRINKCLPDLRFGRKNGVTPPKSGSIDAFMSYQYNSVAEPLPTKYPGET